MREPSIGDLQRDLEESFQASSPGLPSSQGTLHTRAGLPPTPGVGAMAIHAGAHVATTTSETDIYFSADIETDGPIPGPFSMLSFALVVAGTFDGVEFVRAKSYERSFYSELRPISDQFEPEALRVNGLERERLVAHGPDPQEVMTAAYQWIEEQAQGKRPVLVAYPLSFDWTWLYWYFVRFATGRSPFEHSRCFDLKTAFAVKANLPICRAGRSKVPGHLLGKHPHTHHALDDAIEQAELFANIFEWGRRA